MESLEAEEQSIAAMLLAGVPRPDIAATLRVDQDTLEERLDDMFVRLQHRRPASGLTAPRALGESRSA